MQQEESNKNIMQFLSGTDVYYGSTIAMEAKHGSYLTFADTRGDLSNSLSI
jgi:hypothetical protein